MTSLAPPPVRALLREGSPAVALPPVAILAGGLGTWPSEETDHVPKPLIEIGGHPVLWHVMRHYYTYGMSEFVVALGWKKEAVIRYFLDLYAVDRDLTIHTRDGSLEFHDGNGAGLDWTVHLIDTRPDTLSGGRVKRLAHYVGNGTFMLTRCDRLSDVNLADLLAFHRAHGKLATVITARSPSHLGHLDIGIDNVVHRLHNEPNSDTWTNGAFFVLEPGIFDYIAGDFTVWEHESLKELIADGELVAYRHRGFMHCVDTPRDKRRLDELWNSGNAPWKIWD
jgi:glucose-1-phosphate cytidylyltransferase